jgi:hypothetical protein
MNVRVYNARHINCDARLILSADDGGVSAVQADGNGQAITSFGKDPVLKYINFSNLYHT